MNHFESYTLQPELASDLDRFALQCLEQLKQMLAQKQYANYPTQRLSYFNGARIENGVLCLPEGPWETADNGRAEPLALQERPLHPWIDSMLANPDIGVVTGRGAYWQWGPNYTADSIVVRHDLEEPCILLIRRSDTGQLALPGGFIDTNEPALTAALRETAEETSLDLASLNPLVRQVYTGPLADLRVTANAWPVTSAFRFDIPQPPPNLCAGDDATDAVWLPISQIHEHLFGSHRLLIELALNS